MKKFFRNQLTIGSGNGSNRLGMDVSLLTSIEKKVKRKISPSKALFLFFDIRSHVAIEVQTFIDFLPGVLRSFFARSRFLVVYLSSQWAIAN